MSNFKIGERVVWVTQSVENELCVIPNVNDIITLKSYVDDGHWDVIEFPCDKNGNLQCLSEINFRKLDAQFGEDVIAELNQQFNSTKRVLVHHEDFKQTINN